MRQIAIDGPAGAGKSTVAKALSERLNINYMDTGAMYRTVALGMIRKGVDLSDREQILSNLDDLHIEVVFENRVQKVLLNGEDVSGFIRTPEVSMGASTVAVVPEVRIKLVELQRETANRFDIVMDGRDIGTYVLPDAKVKFYITASSRERARRRARDLDAQGIAYDLDELEKEIIKRDEQDMNREFAPLKVAEDAIYLDTSNMSIEEVIDFTAGKVREIYE
ncbi:MAG: (d)CMP kinase [Clostridia bacterium]|nr:(d)CMP kinase [Clostridia bacterium]